MRKDILLLGTSLIEIIDDNTAVVNNEVEDAPVHVRAHYGQYCFEFENGQLVQWHNGEPVAYTPSNPEFESVAENPIYSDFRLHLVERLQAERPRLPHYHSRRIEQATGLRAA